MQVKKLFIISVLLAPISCNTRQEPNQQEANNTHVQAASEQEQHIAQLLEKYKQLPEDQQSDWQGDKIMTLIEQQLSEISENNRTAYARLVRYHQEKVLQRALYDKELNRSKQEESSGTIEMIGMPRPAAMPPTSSTSD